MRKQQKNDATRKLRMALRQLQLTLQLPAPEAVLRQISCKCNKNCGGNCDWKNVYTDPFSA